MAAYTEFTKAPASILDYLVNWAAWLGADTIATSAWTVPTGLTKTTDSKTTTGATVWLSGGTEGEEYLITNLITTAGGRTAQKSFMLKLSFT